MNPLTLISGFSLQTKALLIAGIAITSFAGGWHVHGWRTQAKQAASITKQLKTSDTIVKTMQVDAKQAQVAAVETKIIYRTIKEKIYAENDNRICFADATALGLWNDAIAGKDSHRPSPTGKTAEPYSVVTTVEQVLTNATENFEICNTNNISHNALIDTIEKLDGKMCVCAK